MIGSGDDADHAARRGQREVTVVLHGARPEVHDWVAGEAGSYRAAIATLTAARSLGLRTTARTRLTRSNARVVGELPRLLRARAVSRWVVAVDGVFDTAVTPRLGLAVPSALSAIEQARELGVEGWLLGVPRCVMGRFADRAWPAAPRAFAPRCDGCAVRAACGGVDPDYLARFGAGELRPAEPR